MLFVNINSRDKFLDVGKLQQHFSGWIMMLKQCFLSRDPTFTLRREITPLSRSLIEFYPALSVHPYQIDVFNMYYYTCPSLCSLVYNFLGSIENNLCQQLITLLLLRGICVLTKRASLDMFSLFFFHGLQKCVRTLMLNSICV